MHPDTLEAHPCRVTVARRGLLLQRLADEHTERGSAGTLRVPWWTVQGFSADGTETAPDGTVRQLVEVVTDAGTLLLLTRAPDVSDLLAQVAGRSGRWRRARRPLSAAAARRMALVVGGLELRGPEGTRHGVASWPGAVARRVWHPVEAALARPGGRTRVLVRFGAAGAVTLLTAGAALVAVTGGGPSPSGAADPYHAVGLGRAGSKDVGAATTVRLLPDRKSNRPLVLPPATAPPAPAPPSLADAPPLQPHEVFGFAPYWTLTQSAGFNVGGLTTIAYFSIGVNPDGSLDQSGAGWEGYESQDLVNLVNRAHASGVRVVLTVNCFDQGALNQLTSSSTAPATLSAAVVQAIEAKNLDGLNIDFEGEGSGDQAGLTNLVTKVSGAVHAANPHYQVTMDTYASSAGDPGGFYDIPALAPAVDGFFVMAYQLNLQSPTNPASPLTSSMFSDLTTAQQYAAAVPPSKVILGVPFYGEQWPTTNGTMSAQATGTATPVSDAQIVAGGHPAYWDDVTQTAWTSYQSAGQWYEEYYEDPASLYLIAQTSQLYDLGGVGAWALGMDGNDPQMLAALDGFAPASKATPAGPPSASPTASTTTTSTTTAPAPPTGSTTTTSTTTPTGSTTTSSPGTSDGAAPRYSGTWEGQTVSLALQPWTTVQSLGAPEFMGRLTGFQTNDPAYACLSTATGLSVWAFGSSPTVDTVVAEQPTDCVDAEFTLVPPPTPPAGSGSTTPPQSGSGTSSGSGNKTGSGTGTKSGGSVTKPPPSITTPTLPDTRVTSQGGG
ncbi:MAG: glycosyl hydrolase family 18 protein [Acidimicrobiales bacterium]